MSQMFEFDVLFLIIIHSVVKLEKCIHD